MATFYVTNNNNSGAGSLRAACESAAHNDTVIINGGMGAITLQGDIPLNGKCLNIIGQGASSTFISGGNSSRLFWLNNGVGTYKFKNLTLCNASQSALHGNAKFIILDHVNLVNCINTSNGGAITINADKLTGLYCTFQSCHSGNNGGVMAGNCNVDLSNTVCVLNSANNNGGVMSCNGKITTHHCWITDNSAGNNSGVFGMDTAAFSNTQFHRNHAGNNAGVMNSRQENFTLVNVIAQNNTDGQNSGDYLTNL